MLVGLASCSDDPSYYGKVTFDVTGLFVDITDATRTTYTRSTTFSLLNVAQLEIDEVPDGWEVELDFYRGTVTVTATQEAITLAKEALANIDPTTTTPEDGFVETVYFTGETHDGYAVSASLTVGVVEFVRFDSAGKDMQANSMIVTEPGKLYIFDPTYKGEQSMGQRVSGIGECELLWRSNGCPVRHVQMLSDTETAFYTTYDKNDYDDDDDYLELVPGNGVIAAYNWSDEVLWSWHIWCTQTEVESITFNGKTFMDRNLGAAMNVIETNYSDTDDILFSYGLYYQWGRKDPFIQPLDYKTSMGYDGILLDKDGSATYIVYEDCTSSIGRVDYAIKNPMTYIIGIQASTYDWIYSAHDGGLWNNAQKSVYDPSPKGWRVPLSGDFVGVTVSSIPSTYNYVYGAELQGSGGEYADFMGAGYRAYIDGQIHNTNSLFAPWVGYYWTSGAVSTDAKASSFLFSNEPLLFYGGSTEEILASYPMYRANGMQIRCVKNEN